MLTDEYILRMKISCYQARQFILRMIYGSPNDGHPGGALSMVEILTALMVGEHRVMKFNPEKPDDPANDLLILSKGHASAALYVAFYQAGLITLEQLMTFRHNFSSIQGHPHLGDLPWIHYSGGILGGGLSFANGFLLDESMPPPRVFCILGDGECNEGQVWEALQSLQQITKKRKDFPLCVIVDWNKAQLDGSTEQIKDQDLYERLQGYGAHVFEVDGHSVFDIHRRLQEFDRQPVILVCNTLKGKGLPSWEAEGWKVHGSVPKGSTLVSALAELAEHSDPEGACHG